ncbi:RNA polymerase sigma factor [Amycolatopsis sp. NPDC051903]|uniref:RNA polymerase sigma factor n=1 Tax=Amycolatopsis sp. NPDC051903 TaxID=3363936 RepID=UPI0037BBE033
MTPGGSGDAEDDHPEDLQKRLRRFYHQHHGVVLKFVGRRVAPVDAEDVCQEVWLVFFAKYSRAAVTDEHAANVLFPIARIKIADYRRRRGRLRENAVRDESLTLLAESLRSSPEVAVNTTVRMDLERALAVLPARQREALHLHYVDDLKIDQTATLMGIAATTVKSLRTRGLEALRTMTVLEAYRREDRG